MSDLSYAYGLVRAVGFYAAAERLGMSESDLGLWLNTNRRKSDEDKVAEAKAKADRKVARRHSAWLKLMKTLTWRCPKGRRGLCDCASNELCPFGDRRVS